MLHTKVVDGPQIGNGVNMVMWDTPGDIYDLREIDPVQNVNCVVLCYSVDYPESLSDIDGLVNHITPKRGRVPN